VSLSKEGNVFYYLIDPNEDQANIIIEAIPVNQSISYEIYVKKKEFKVQEQFESYSSIPVWMIPKEEIKNEADDYVKYFEESSYEEITLNIKNEKNLKQEVLLIYLTSEEPESKHPVVELVVTSSSVQPLKLNQRYFGSVRNAPGKYKIYEAFVDASKDNSTFLVEVDNCLGSSEIFVAKSFGDLIESNLEYKSSKQYQGKIYAPLPTPKQGSTKYVIGVASNNDKFSEFKTDTFSEYYIETRSF
jgi:hypothetical protein